MATTTALAHEDNESRAHRQPLRPRTMSGAETSVADTIERAEFRETLNRIDGKLDRLDEKFEAAIQGRVSVDVFQVTVKSFEQRLSRLEGRPERWLPWLAVAINVALWLLNRGIH